jgi:putative adhesin
MRVQRIVFPLLTVSVLCAGAMGVARAQQNPQQNSQQVTVPLSDPSRPGTLSVNLLWGGITITGTNRKDVSIEARSSDETRGRGRGRGGLIIEGGGIRILRGRGGNDGDGDTTGLRRLTQPGGFEVEEHNNEVSVASGARNRGSDFTIQVPTRTNLKLSALNDGPILVENVEGEIEVNNQNESITLTNVAGSVVANAHNGRVKVVMTRLTADKAMAFTSFNGNVDVTLPASAKANLKMRSDMGEIFTDFDVQLRPATSAAPQSGRRSDGGFRLDVNQSIQGAVNGGGPEFELRTFNGNIYLRKGAR